MEKYKPVVLIILDGWGIRENEFGNAVVQAKTPNIDRWLRSVERSILDASGESVGLTQDQMGNSEVGHLSIGSGRIVFQAISRIDGSIADGSFFESPILLESLQKLKKIGSKLHLFGLLGPGGVHSHTRHLHALLKLTQEMNIEPLIHVITDGRDTPPKSGIDFVRDLEEYIQGTPGIIASVTGRYYAMDRDNRWERTKAAYDAYVHRSGLFASTATEAVYQSYAEEVTDEFIKPTLINPSVPLKMNITEEDCLVFFNFRSDRMRQIVKSFLYDDFENFDRQFFVPKLDVITFTEYEKGLPVKVVFPKVIIANPLAKVVSERGLKQFHSAETEKYSHVTFFFNGGREESFEGEDRFLVSSPKVATYDLKPEMSAFALTDVVEARIEEQIYDFIVMNYANMDMVGHTGRLEAAIKAVEAVDTCVGRIVESVTRIGGISIVTSDHGNAEMEIDKINNEAHTYHTTSPVALFVIGKDYFRLRPMGTLADIAPTVLDLMGISTPDEMTGRSLIEAWGSSD